MIALGSTLAVARATELIRLTEATWDDAAPQGKEVDCIYGDLVLRNNRIVVVIANPIKGRNANMTVRNVDGAVIDLTLRDAQSDQLSAYYPLNAQYDLSMTDDEAAKKPADGKLKSAPSISLLLSGPATDGQSKADVTYTLADNDTRLKIVTRVTNTSDKPLDIGAVDSIRADGEFEFGQADGLGLFGAYDRFWQQAYGVLTDDPAGKVVASSLKRGEKPELRIHGKNLEGTVAPGGVREVVRYLYPAANSLDALASARELRGEKLSKIDLTVSDPAGPVERADVTVKTAEGETVGHGQTDSKGRLNARLPSGRYDATVSAQGRGEKVIKIDAAKDAHAEVALAAPGYFVAKITDNHGARTACKVQFTGRGDTPTPNFGPDSAIHGIRNVYYTADGKFRAPLAPGEYDVIISYGPEYDAEFTTIKVTGGNETPLAAELKRTVDTRGWLSTDFHSHSTPSGDNTSSQRGRVLNLLAEHIEFAPCTEHNRITVYTPHIEHFDAASRMLSCPGMELTGRPLPINHQNAFPLTPKPRTQDGGAPKHDEDPIMQIERLAMWENGSDKLVQINHPNLIQMVGDRDLDGKPDGGFEKMFSFMDVIEIHPPYSIFSRLEALPKEREQGNTIFNWLQLLNLGYRLPGVVNTDAHWNFHGSGWLRNYVKTKTDEPAKALVADLVHECEHGHIVVTNGPFLEAAAKADNGGDTADVGDDLKAPGGKLHMKIRVQCPNWLEVNRVQIFVNGVPDPKLNFTRRSHPAMFHQGTIVFDENVPVELKADAHLVVACAGEDKQLGPVVGPDHAKEMPTAVGNPIFVDIDGEGFKPNGDMLGLPLPIGPGLKPSKPHKH